MMPMSTVQCLFCQHLNPAHAAFCNECGQALNLRPCPQCQASNDREATTCQRCGTELSTPASQAPGQSGQLAPSASDTESLLWSRTRDGGMNPALLSEMGATANSARRRMFIAVAALVMALIAYGASVYFYGLPGQRPPSQAQSAPPTTVPAVPAETPRSANATPSAVTAPQESSPKTPELPPTAALGLTDETAPSSFAPSPVPSLVFADCPPAVAALGLCQPSSSPPLTRQETP